MNVHLNAVEHINNIKKQKKKCKVSLNAFIYIFEKIIYFQKVTIHLNAIENIKATSKSKKKYVKMNIKRYLLANANL